MANQKLEVERTMKKYILVALVVLPMLLTSCLNSSGNNKNQNDLKGQILVWHSWQGGEREDLDKLLGNFTNLYPNVKIVEESFSLDEIENRFETQVVSGYGPDILIVPGDWAKRLADKGMIRDIGSQEVDIEPYLTSAINVLKDGDHLYGLPLSLNTYALYYNKMLLAPNVDNSNGETFVELIQQQQETITDTEALDVLNNLLTQVESTGSSSEPLEPAKTLDDLSQQANAGQKVAMPSDFYGAFWGVSAFGGQLFDEENRIILNQGGFANWLGWLKQAQDNPNIILNRKKSILSDLFTTGKVTYYIGNSNELPVLQEALGEDMVGVVRLPARQNKTAGPFLEVEGLVFSQASTEKSLQIALRLGQYLTNAEQQLQLALDVGKIPTNKRVKIDPRVSPIVAEFVAQSKTAIPINLQNIDKVNDVRSTGNTIYGSVLDGEISIGEAANSLTQQVNEKYGLETLKTNLLKDCNVTGKIVLWHTWQEAEQEALTQISNSFMAGCPETSISVERVDPTEFHTRYVEAKKAGNGPDIFINSNRQLASLANEGLVQNIAELLDPDFLQRFTPAVEESTLYQGNSHGLPISMNTMVLYYNTSIVKDPPVVIDELLTIATPETQIAIPTGFLDAYWGISAFGESSDSPLFDEEKRLIIGQWGLPEWLSWLKEAQGIPGMLISDDKEALQASFLAEEAAYLVGDVTMLSKLQTELGTEKVGVVPLPSGAPLLLVDLAMLNPSSDETNKPLALKFAQYLTDVESQEILLQTNKVPVNINVDVDVTKSLAIQGFMEQSAVAIVIPNIPETSVVFEKGDVLYEQILKNNLDPIVAVEDFTYIVNVTNGIEVETKAVGVECTEEDNGNLLLWHSWTETEQLAWQQVISDFATVCPNIQLETSYISPLEFTEQLTSTLEADSGVTAPDFFISSHEALESYRTAELVRNIDGLIDKELTVSHLPGTIVALSANGELYGLPQTVNLSALYYNTDLVQKPAQTFEGLLLQNTEGLTIGIHADFYDLLWGAAAFGCQPCQTGEFFNEQGELTLTRDDLVAWKDWLDKLKLQKNIFFSSDLAELEKMFADGQIAYLVANSSNLNDLQKTLGVAKVGVALLPANETEVASAPFLRVQGFMFSKIVSEEQTKLALKFATFATSQAKQTLLMQTANLIPTDNLSLATADDSRILTIANQIGSSVLLPNQTQLSLLEAEKAIYTIFDDLVE
jgi:maltose-binding protein MalE